MKEIIDIIKNVDIGGWSHYPRFMLKFWLLWQTWINRSCVLITHINFKLETTGFILFDINRNEVVMMAVKPKYHRRGIGTELLKMLPKDKDIIVQHRKSHEQSYRFYIKNGFKPYLDLANNRVLSIKKVRVCNKWQR